MRCKNCGNELKSTEKFCTLCGNYVDDDDIHTSLEDDRLGRLTKKEMKHASQPNPAEDFPPPEEEKPKKEKKKKEIEIPDDIGLDEDVNRIENPNWAAYIGEDYKWVVDRPFNIYALLLSWMYFLYRKLYLIGIIGLAITGIILIWIPAIIVPYIVLSMVFSGIFFNRIYLMIVEKRVAKIEQNATDLGEFGVEDKCKKQGGVNVFIPLVIFFLFLVIVLTNMFHFEYGGKLSKYFSESSSNQANCKSMGKRITTSLTDYGIEGSVEEMACEITMAPNKEYHIYLKVTKDGKTEYVYFQTNRNGYFEVKANTTMIPELETLQKDYGLAQNYQEFLTLSKELSNKFSSLKDESEYEDKLIEKGKDKQAKTHFIFSKDDILN